MFLVRIPSSFHFFLLLFGFFLGNLSPSGFFFSNENDLPRSHLHHSFSEIGVFSQQSPMMPNLEKIRAASLPNEVGQNLGQKTEQTIGSSKKPFKTPWMLFPVDPSQCFTGFNTLLGGQMTKDSNKLKAVEWFIEKGSLLPGPAPTILFISEFLNYLLGQISLTSSRNAPLRTDANRSRTRYSTAKGHLERSSSASKRNNWPWPRFSWLRWGLSQEKRGSNEPSFSRLCREFQPFPVVPPDSVSPDSKGGGVFKKYFILIARSLNSIKIGFFLGIFVDAFKVGS